MDEHKIGTCRVYEAKKPDPCKVCGIRDSVLLPIVEIDGKRQWFPVCQECRDLVPHKVIPVESKLDAGFIFYNGKCYRGKEMSDPPPDTSRGIMTRYGKLLEQQKGTDHAQV